jgi:hypothetical protein
MTSPQPATDDSPVPDFTALLRLDGKVFIASARRRRSPR